MATRVVDTMEMHSKVSEMEEMEDPHKYYWEETVLLEPREIPGGQTARRPGVAVGSQHARKAPHVDDTMKLLSQAVVVKKIKDAYEHSKQEPLHLGPSAFPGNQTARRPGVAVGASRTAAAMIHGNKVRQSTQREGSQQARKASRVDDVMELLCQLAQVKEMKAAYDHSKQGAMLAGFSAFIGGMLAGPPGIAVGGALGGLLGYWRSSGKFKPVPQILLELSLTERKKLCQQVLGIIRHLDWTDARHLIALVMKNPDLQQQLIGVLGNYLHKILRAKIAFGK